MAGGNEGGGGAAAVLIVLLWALVFFLHPPGAAHLSAPPRALTPEEVAQAKVFLRALSNAMLGAGVFAGLLGVLAWFGGRARLTRVW